MNQEQKDRTTSTLKSYGTKAAAGLAIGAILGAAVDKVANAYQAPDTSGVEPSEQFKLSEPLSQLPQMPLLPEQMGHLYKPGDIRIHKFPAMEVGSDKKPPICHSGNGKNWVIIRPDDSSYDAHLKDWQGKAKGHDNDGFASDINGDGEITKEDCVKPTEAPEATNTPKLTDTLIPTRTEIPTKTVRPTETPIHSATPELETETPTNTPTKTKSPTSTSTPTQTSTQFITTKTPTHAPTETPIPSATPGLKTETPSKTPIVTNTPTVSETPSPTMTETLLGPSLTPTDTLTPKEIVVPTITPTAPPAERQVVVRVAGEELKAKNFILPEGMQPKNGELVVKPENSVSKKTSRGALTDPALGAGLGATAGILYEAVRSRYNSGKKASRRK